MKFIKAKIIFTALIFMSSCAGQTKTENNTMDTVEQDTTYLLGGYLINPSKKTVSVYEMTGGSELMPDGELRHWDGYQYTLDTTINYDSTALLIVGNQFYFKEHVELFRHLDLNTLKVIYASDGELICRDKNYIYKDFIGERKYAGRYETLKISDFKVINDYVYERKGELYFLSKDGDLKKIEGVSPDVQTLKHLTDNYFTDKNGLYLLGGYSYIENQASYSYDKSVQLEKSGGKVVKPLVAGNFFVYGSSVYSPSPWSAHRPLPLEAAKVKEIEIDSYYKICIIADGEHAFEAKGNDGYSTAEYQTKWYKERYPDEFFHRNVNEWQIISDEYMNFIKKDDGKTLYFPSGTERFQGALQSHILIKRPDGFYIFDEGQGSSLQKINNVYFFNFDIQKYEELDADSYRYISPELRTYKGRVYGANGLPVKEYINVDSLRFISRHGSKTNYLTDGKQLIYIGNMGGYASEGEGGKTMQILNYGDRGRIVSGADFPTLKVINKDVLIDCNNIYNGNYDGIGVIPLKALNLDVNIFMEE